MRRIALVLVPLLAFACRGDRDATPAEIREAIADTPATDVMEQAAASEWTPPEHGKLTPDQVEWYLDVRAYEKQILAAVGQDLAAQTAGSATTAPNPGRAEVTVAGAPAGATDAIAEAMAADVRAARELGHDPLEYQWVKGQVLQAQLANYTADWDNVESGRDLMLRTLDEMRAAADPETAREIERRIAELQSESPPRAGAQNRAISDNAALVAQYDGRLREIESWPEMPVRSGR